MSDRPAGRIGRRRPLIWLAVALFGLVLLEAADLFFVADSAARANFSNILQSVTAALGAGVFVAAARRLRRERSEAAAGWTLFCVGAGLFLAGQLAFWLVELSSGSIGFPNASDPFFLAAYLVLVLAFSRLPREHLVRDERVNAVLDFAVLALVTVIGCWELSLRDLWTNAWAEGDGAALAALAYALLNLVLLLALYRQLVMNLGRGRMFVPNLLLVASGLFLAAADLAMVQTGLVGFRSGSWVDLGWVLFAALAGLAATYILQRGDAVDVTHSATTRATWATALNYVVLAAGAGVLVWGVADGKSTDLALFGITAVVVLGLAAARAMRAIRGSARLAENSEEARAALETRVRERTSELEAAASSLRQSESRYRGLFELDSDALVLVDNESGRILEANAAAAALYGYTHEELLGTTNSALSAEPEATRMVTAASSTAPDAILLIPLRWHRKQDGTVFPVEITARAFLDEDRPVHLAAIRDITERRLAEETLRASAARYRELFESASDALFVVSHATARIVDANSMASSVYGYQHDEMVGRLSMELSGEPEETATFISEAQARAGEVVTVPRRLHRRKDGSVFPVELTARSIDWAGEPALLIACRDITERTRAEETLRASREQLRLISDSTEDSVYSFDLDGRFTSANRHFCETLGLRPEQVVGRTPPEVGLPEDRFRELAAIHLEVMATDQTVVREVEMPMPDGGVHVAELVMNPLHDRDGRVIGIAETSRDITERKAVENRLRASETRYRAMFNHAIDGIFQSTPGGRSLAANPSFVQMLGYASEQELLDTLVDLPRQLWADPDERARVARLIEANGSVRGYECRFVRKDGTTLWIELNATVIQEADGGATYFHGSIEDVTARRAAEEEIRRLNTDLERRVRERTAELAAANRKMQAAVTELESFSYSISHDLRAPLRSINGFAALLERSLGERLDAKGRHYLDVIESEAERMGILIEELLDYSRLGRESVRSEPVPLERIVAALRSTYGARMEEARASLAVVEPLAVPAADPLLLERILANLLDNALTYARPGVPARITLSATRTEEGVTVALADNGIGIPEQFREQIFEVFTRLHPEGTYPGGTGIGLSIVRKAARLMGSEVSVTSLEGEGSTFSLLLPAAGEGSGA